MTRRTHLIAVLAFALTAGTGWAHEGHVHTVMGTVTMHHDNHLQVKTADGKTVDIVLDAKTTVVRGAKKLTVADLSDGQRVVVDVGDGKTPLTARVVKLGAAGTVAAKPAAAKAHEHHD